MNFLYVCLFSNGLNTISNGEVICPNCHRVEHEGRK